MTCCISKGGRSGTLTCQVAVVISVPVSPGRARRTPLISPSARLSLAKMTRGLGEGRSVKQADGRVKLKLSPSTRSVFRKTCPRAGRRQRGVMCMLYIRGDIPAYG